MSNNPNNILEPIIDQIVNFGNIEKEIPGPKLNHSKIASKTKLILIKLFEEKKSTKHGLITLGTLEKIGLLDQKDSNYIKNIQIIVFKILEEYKYLLNLLDFGAINIFDLIALGMISEKNISFLHSQEYAKLLLEVISKCKSPFEVNIKKIKLDETKNLTKKIISFTQKGLEYDELNVIKNNGKENGEQNDENITLLSSLKNIIFEDDGYLYRYEIKGINIQEITGKMHELTLKINEATSPNHVLKILFNELSGAIPMDRISFALIQEKADVYLSSISAYTEDGRPNPIGETASKSIHSGGFLDQTLKKGEIVIINNLMKWTDERYRKHGYEIPRLTHEILKAGYNSSITIPIKTNGKSNGIIFINSLQTDIYSQHEVDYLIKLMGTINFSIDKIMQLILMQEQSQKDNLTKLHNRTYFETRKDEYVQQQVEKFEKKEKNNGALIMLDLDYFKMVNDKYGHDGGDQVLKHVSRTIINTLRANDKVIRRGGEEFLIYLDGCDENGAVAAMKRLQRAINIINIPYGNLQINNISVSAGIVLFNNGVGEFGHFDKSIGINNMQLLINIADKLLYMSKIAGRSCYTRLNTSLNLGSKRLKLIEYSGEGVEEILKFTEILEQNNNSGGYLIDQKYPLAFEDFVTKEKEDTMKINSSPEFQRQILEGNIRLILSEKIPLNIIKEISQKFTLKSYQHGEVMIEKNTPIEKIFVILDGAAKIIYDNKSSNTQLEYQTLKHGDLSIIPENDIEEIFEVEIKADGICTVWEIDIDDVKNYLKDYPELLKILWHYSSYKSRISYKQ